VTNSVIFSMLNSVQALYRNPTLGYKFRVEFLQIKYLDKNSTDNAGGYLNDYLKNFCDYVNKLPRDGVNTPDHWDVALLLTGTDMYAKDSAGKRNYVTSGQAYRGEACNVHLSCAIAEARGGLKSDAFVIAHELGHCLGMQHDSNPPHQDCDRKKFIMSPSPGYDRSGDWSKCSFNDLVAFMNSKKATCFENDPLDSGWKGKIVPVGDKLAGQYFSADEQCASRLGPGKMAYLGIMDNKGPSYKPNYCNELFCKSKDTEKISAIGSALDGTYCGDMKTQGCYLQKCVPLAQIPKDRYIGTH